MQLLSIALDVPAVGIAVDAAAVGVLIAVDRRRRPGGDLGRWFSSWRVRHLLLIALSLGIGSTSALLLDAGGWVLLPVLVAAVPLLRTPLATSLWSPWSD